MRLFSTARALPAVTCLFLGASAAPAAVVVAGKAPKAAVVADAGPLTPAQQAVMDETRQWLVDAVRAAGGATLPVADREGTGPTVLLTTAAARPDTAKRLKLRTDHHDAYAIESTPDRVTLIGSNVYALQHAVAHVLHDLGFRYYAPSPKWHVVPALPTVRVETNAAGVPSVGARKIWYAYGQPDKALDADYHAWARGNRLSSHALINTGHSYGNIVQRNAAEFERHPEYFALLESGERDSTRAAAARKFCVSNPGLKELVARDRIKLLGEMRKANPLAYMVSVDPSDGQGTCHCEHCKALGTPTDRVIHLANHVAREVRKVYPGGWVGLYAYSSHRLPPTVAVEPNVCVQVAFGFNNTEFTLPELVERWGKKVSAIGLREYYGVEAWDWGLPGRMRGAKPDYHREWIPYYAARRAVAFNGETNANWGGQALGLYVAAALMWDVTADVDAIRAGYLADCFGAAAPAMRDFQKKLEAGGPLQAAALAPLFADLDRAAGMTTDGRVRARLADLMAYLVYAEEYRRFEAAAAARPGRDDEYYKALRPLMTYAWRIRGRDVVHYYALARRLCNGLPVQDDRPEFYLARKDAPPVWMVGAPLTDAEVEAMFRERAAALRADAGRHATFSRMLQPVRPPGPDAGASTRAAEPKDAGVSAFRKTVKGYLVGGDREAIPLDLKPVNRPVTFTVFGPKDEVLLKETAANKDAFTAVTFTTPKAGEYRFALEGEAVLRVKPGTPLVYEASAASPAWVDYSGPHYFYVPRGTGQVYADSAVRLSLVVPGQAKRVEVTPGTRAPGRGYTAVEVPAGADGRVWHTDRTTRGPFSLLNVPPLLGLSREKVFVPREVAESDGLTTAR